MEKNIKEYTRKDNKIFKLLCRVIDLSGLKHFITGFRFGRKLYGGTWYLIWNWLPMNVFWCDRLITSCGGRSIKTEIYSNK